MPETYENANAVTDRTLQCADRALHRDECGAWCIGGTRGIDNVCTSMWGELIDEVSDEMRKGILAEDDASYSH